MIAAALQNHFSNPESFEERPLADCQTQSRLSAMFKLVDDGFRRTARDWRSFAEALLREIEAECAQSNWDGYDALPVSQSTLTRTHEVLTALQRLVPPLTPAPDLVPERDGDISLTWELSVSKVFSVSVNESGVLNFAGVLGPNDERHGQAKLDIKNTKPLRPIVEAIESLYEKQRQAA